MNVREIIEEYLKAHGFDGLYNNNGQCACEIGDLSPCYENSEMECEPGYMHHCKSCAKAGTVDPNSDEICDIDDMPQESGWCISPSKEQP